MKVDGSMGSLIQGVSQQPPRNRLPGQCAEQINLSSNPVDGLTRRPPLEQIAKLFESADDAQFYDYSLGIDKNYILVALTNSLRVFDVDDGSEKTVNVENDGGDLATDYLDGGDLAFTTLDGTTYIANRTKEVAMLPDVKDYVTTGGLVYLLGGAYGRTYTVSVHWDGTSTSSSYTVPDGSSSAHTAFVTTTHIASALRDNLNTNPTFSAEFTAYLEGDVIYIKKTTAPLDEKFEIRVEDGDGGSNMVAVNGTVTDAANLPKTAPQGYVIKITGSGEADIDDWYVQFDMTPDNDGNVPAAGDGFGREGFWLETVAPDTPYLMDKLTMPHVLTYDSVADEFTLSFGDWAGRQVGDETSNEDPSFVGDTIEDLGYFQGRLCMLSGPALIMSRTDKPYDFWLESVTILADSDPIDIESTIKGVRKMYRMIPFDRDLIVFADKGQFIVFGRNKLTPQNSSLVLTTAFEADLTAAPVAAGHNVFFPIKYGQYAGIQEFFTQDAVDANDSRPITQHVLKYLRGRAQQLATSSNFDLLLVRTDQEMNKLYAYEYIWLGNEKVQTSWSTWTFPNEIVYTFFIESEVYVVTKLGNAYLFNKMDLDIHDDTGLDYQTKLDRKITITGVNTTITDPYIEMPDPADIVFIQGEGCPYPGMRVLATNVGNTFTLYEDMEGGDVICGVRYESLYKPTIPSVKDQDGVKIGTGNLIISKFLINFKDTGHITGRVTSQYGDDQTVEFTGRYIGDPTTTIGNPAVVDGTFIVPFRHNRDYAEVELCTDSHLPMTITDIEWMGQYSKKGRRITEGRR